MAGGKIDVLVEPDTKGFPGKLESGLKGSLGVAGKIGKGIALALAAGTVVAGAGFGVLIAKGKEYQANLNELQAVTQATAIDMKRVGDTAKALGADMSLPATSAADAAAAMVELAKGGLSVNESMKAAKGTLQLAAAAQIDAAQAAEIQSNALNEFGLSADQAGHVADVLANTANAASGSIVDMANALKFVGPVAKGLSISIDNTSAALGLLANNGIKGEQAGTSLRGILASLASPSAAAAKALKVLGVQAFDNQGKFVGLRTITDQLSKAKGKLSEASFAAAASTAFGNEGFTAANALAQEGAKSFDEMAVAVSRAGGASDVAAAKTKGLGGAIEGFNSQVETAGIGIFEKIAPTLEKGVRAAADVVARITPAVVSGIGKAVAAGEVFGPLLADAIKQRAGDVVSAAREVLAPLAEAVPGLLNKAVNTAIDLSGNVSEVFGNVVQAAKPAAKGIGDVAKASVEADGPLSALSTGAGLVGDAFGAASGILVPIGKIVGGIASAFAALPGPIQSAVVALGLAAAFKGPMGSLGDTIKTRVTAPFKAMGEEIRLQQALLTGSTNIMSSQVGKVGLAMASLESRVPVIGKIADAYRNVSTATEGAIRGQGALIATSLAIKGASEGTVGAVERASGALGKMAGVASGAAAALGTGLKSAASGLVSAFGGPWGVAIAAVTVGLSLLAGANEQAAAKEREHKASVDSLAGSLRESNGAITDAVRKQVGENLVAHFDKAVKGSERLGLGLDHVTTAALKQGPAYDEMIRHLDEVIAAGTTEVDTNSAKQVSYDENAQAASDVKMALVELARQTEDAVTKNKRLDEAIKGGNVSMLDATGAGRSLSGAMGVLADKTASADDKARALKQAFDALSGDQVSLEAAQARLNEQLGRLSDAFGENVDKTKGFGAALVNANGSINTTLPNGQLLFQSMQDISGSMLSVAQQTFDASKAAGDDLPTALAKAKQSAQLTRDSVIALGEKLGLTPPQIQAIADHMGLLPDEVAVAITLPGMTDAQKELVLVNQKIKDIPPGKSVKITSLTDEAKKTLQDLGFIVQTLPDGSVAVSAQTADAKAKFDQLIANISNKVVSVKVVPFATALKGAGGFAKGGITVPAYAAGGLRDVTPMRGGVAQIVPPNSMRIIGDRMVDDEAYIPINQSSRSLALLQETARRMHMSVVRRFATGGVTGQGTSFPNSEIAFAPEVRVFIGDQELTDLVDVRISHNNRQTRQRVLAGAGGGL